MNPESVFVISDESDPEDSSSIRRKADEQDPLEGRRILRKKKPKVENEVKKDQGVVTSEKKEEEIPEVKKSDIEPPDDPRYDILTTLEGASFQSRLPFDKMTTFEVVAFPEFNTKNITIVDRRMYLNIRNRILKMWLENVKHQLTYEFVLKNIEKPFDMRPKLIERIFLFLDRYGYINYGIFQKVQEIKEKRREKIIIIGAGISGLMAAQKLQSFGFEVLILESRDRVGGRIATFRKFNYISDIGAMVVTGIYGNPITILAKQLDLELKKIKSQCPLFGPNGKLISKNKDEIIEREFNKILECTSYLSHVLDINYADNEPISLGQALEWIIKLQEKKIKLKKINYLRSIKEIQQEVISNEQAIADCNKDIQNLRDSLSQVMEFQRSSNDDAMRLNYEFEKREIVRDLTKKRKEKSEKKKRNLELETKLRELENGSPPSDVYLSSEDRQILDWHFANLEFANATPLQELSLKHWDQDDDFEFIGHHTTVLNGYSCVPIALSRDLDIRLNTAVTKIKYYDGGVEVTAANMKTNSQIIHKADIVLSTLTLGILKIAIEETSRQANTVRFDPPLPQWKRTSIERLGFGNLNKIILCFDKVFWEPDINLFGHVGSTTASRGELFLFWNIYQLPVLLALVAGQSAHIMENVSDDVIVGRCIAVLKGIFGDKTVPQPKETVVTRWRADPWARGSYSYVKVGSSGTDYDLLASPVKPKTAKNEAKFDELVTDCDEDDDKTLPRLFFAGEHTIRNYPATVHGALLSGLREAGRIADFYIGKIPQGHGVEQTDMDMKKDEGDEDDIIFLDDAGTSK
ncbi:CLUMA_CG000536, isoform A [Clunio marinus]|uniref:Lysine-specific histone demethylase n=1 Tax=Clunio marinus TaxID=568069 RepID=A0A1J1HFF5_9DIPT|nr:CLUMA_CG000536, isoform A [Clunio marinus]